MPVFIYHKFPAHSAPQPPFGRTLFAMNPSGLIPPQAWARGLKPNEPSSPDPTWIASIPDPLTFQNTVSSSYSFLPFTSGFDPARHQFQVKSTTGPLPPRVTVDQITGLVYTASGGNDVASSPTPIIISIINNADYDWTLRSTASGVVAAYKPSLIPTNYFPGGGGNTFVADTVIRCSGASAMRMDWLPTITDANGAGSWTAGSAPFLMGSGFGQNETFYLQFRVRWDSNFINAVIPRSNASGNKTIIVHQGSKSCGSMELTWQGAGRNPYWYTECGNRGIYTQITNAIEALIDSTGKQQTPLFLQHRWIPNGPPWNKETGYEDDYPFSGTGFQINPNIWYTVDLKVVLGSLVASRAVPFDGTDSSNMTTIESWITIAGSTTRQKISGCRMQLTFDNSSADKYNNFTLTPYSTQGLSSQPGVTSSIWYDELIVSTSPIAVPNSLPLGG